METIEGDIEIETPGLPFPFPIEAGIKICGEWYVIYKKEEVFASGSTNHARYICYLRPTNRVK